MLTQLRYGSKLNFEKELGLRLKGENGIMKKKFSALQKDIEDQREEIRTMFAHKKELYQVIQNMLTIMVFGPNLDFDLLACLCLWASTRSCLQVRRGKASTSSLFAFALCLLSGLCSLLAACV